MNEVEKNLASIKKEGVVKEEILKRYLEYALSSYREISERC